jgi:hypothetical protein
LPEVKVELEALYEAAKSGDASSAESLIPKHVEVYKVQREICLMKAKELAENLSVDIN